MLRGLAPLLGVILLAAVTAGAFVAAGSHPPDEPVADINHAVHVEFGLACVDCHTGVESGAAAGVPSITICAECHDDPEDSIGRSANGRLVLDHIASNEELWWPRFNWLPDHVVFSHRRHVALGEIECSRCHGEMEATTTLPEKPLRAMPDMDACMQCHRDAGADQDCFACHK